jgi:hypothetical protein
MPFGSRIGNAAFFAACLLLIGAYAIFLAAPAVGIFHDDGVYLVTAKALAEGRGYRIISVPGEPPQTKYPILFPWLVSLLWRVHPTFPDNVLLLRSIPFFAAVTWLALAWRLLRRLGSSKDVAAIAILLTAVSPWVVFVSTMALSETLFAALLTGAVLVIVRIHQGAGGRFDGLAAGLLMGAAILTRTAGVAPAVAGFIALALKRRWAACALYAVAVLALSAPWFWWVGQNPTDPAVDAFYSATNYGSWNIVSNYSWNEKLIILRRNLLYTVIGLGEFWGLSARTRVGLGLALLCAALIIRGLWIGRKTPVALVVTLYVAMLLAWAWPPGRFIVPIIPMLIWLAILGAGKPRPVARFVALALLLSAGIELWTLAADVRVKGATWFAAGELDDWHAMTRQLALIHDATPEAAVLVGAHDPTYYLFTGRQAVRADSPDPLRIFYNLRGHSPHPIGTPAAFQRRLQQVGADYVVVSPRDGVAPLVAQLSAESPGMLLPVAGSEASGYVIYKVDRDRNQ